MDDRQLTAEFFRRGLRLSKPPVVHLKEMPWSSVRLSRQGTITCIVGFEKSSHVAAIRAAADAADFDQLALLSDRLFANMARLALAKRRLYRNLAAVPVLADFRYGGRIMVRGMLVGREMPIATGTVAYNGGPIEPARFTFGEFYRPDSDQVLESLILVNHPNLTALEKRLLDQVPNSHSEVFVGVQSRAWTPVARAVTEWVAEKVAENLLDDAVDHLQGDGAENDAPARQADAAERQADAAERAADAAERAADAAEREADAAEREADAAEREAAQQEDAADAGEQQQEQQQQEQQQQEQQQEREVYYVTPEEADAGEEDAGDEGANDEGGRRLYERSIRAVTWDALDATSSSHLLLRIRSEALMRSSRNG